MNRGRVPTDRSYSSPRGRSSPSSGGGNYSHRNRHMTGEDGIYSDGFFRGRGGMSRGRRGNASPGSFCSYSNPGPKTAYEYRERKPKDETSHSEGFCSYSNPGPKTAYEYRVRKPKDETSHSEGFQHNQNSSNSSCGQSQQLGSQFLAPSHSEERQLDEKEVHIHKKLVKDGVDGSTLHLDLPMKINISHIQTDCQPSQEQCAKSVGSPGDSRHSDILKDFEPFDICLPKTGGVPMLKPSLLDVNRQKRNSTKRASEEQVKILEEGMVLLKGYLSVDDQVRIVNQCRQIGLGPGGFYQPAYRDGAKLHLKMMCLGKNWDPNTSQYGERRPYDGAKPPAIPKEFHQLVERAMKSSRALVESLQEHQVEDIIPWMSPDICIVNFYSASGQLGLHQDKDESEGSLKKGLPVVSFSIGDTGEFLYGDSRDEKDAKKVLLESGDVLIFGGKSRNVFHGVQSVNTNTADKSLLHETNLRPGRLNLTFRQY